MTALEVGNILHACVHSRLGCLQQNNVSGVCTRTVLAIDTPNFAKVNAPYHPPLELD
jgi:hypothetical protein